MREEQFLKREGKPYFHNHIETFEPVTQFEPRAIKHQKLESIQKTSGSKVIGKQQ